MSVPVRGTIRPARDGRFTEKHASEIGERLIALEKAIRGASPDTFVSPEAPSFGPGSGGGSTTVINNITGVTDHGALTGLLDDDHPQYAQHGEQSVAYPHIHSENDLVGVENRFIRRGESIQPAAHRHTLADVADHSLWEMMLWQRVFGG